MVGMEDRRVESADVCLCGSLLSEWRVLRYYLVWVCLCDCVRWLEGGGLLLYLPKAIIRVRWVHDLSVSASALLDAVLAVWFPLSLSGPPFADGPYNGLRRSFYCETFGVDVRGFCLSAAGARWRLHLPAQAFPRVDQGDGEVRIDSISGATLN